MNPGSINPLHKVIAWLEGLSGKPHATVALLSCAFLEASIFPVPPDVPLIALGISRPNRSILYSILVICGSCTGALLGYYLGNAVFDEWGSRLIAAAGVQVEFAGLLKEYQGNAWPVLLLAGFTPIPFMVFALAAGFHSSVAVPTLVLGALCGRTIRFLPIGIALHLVGPKVKTYLLKYLQRSILIVGLVLLIVVIIVRATR